jgi:hypothetical protein
MDGLVILFYAVWLVAFLFCFRLRPNAVDEAMDGARRPSSTLRLSAARAKTDSTRPAA